MYIYINKKQIKLYTTTKLFNLESDFEMILSLRR